MNDAPGHLAAPEQEAWREVAARWPNGVPMPDGPEFEAYLGQASRLRQAQQQLARDGLIVADPKGTPVPHPALDIERRAQAELRQWGDRFDPAKAARRRR